MNDLRLKFKHIYLPFLIIAVSCIAGYSLMNWLFVIKTEWIGLNDLWTNSFIPLALPWMPLFIWLWPRLKLLKFKRKYSNDPYFLRFLLAAIAIIVPSIIAQQYLSLETGPLLKLKNVNEIKTHALTQYYKFQNFYVDKRHASVYRASRVRGKHNESLDYMIYIACPIYSKPIVDDILQGANYYTVEDKKILTLVNGRLINIPELYRIKEGDIRESLRIDTNAARMVFGSKAQNGALLITTHKSLVDLGYTTKQVKNIIPDAWLAIKYELNLSNQISTSSKDNYWIDFWKDSYADFASKDLSEYEYLSKLRNTSLREEITTAINLARITPKLQQPIIVKPVYEPFEQRSSNKLQWIFGSFGIGAGIWFMFLLRATYHPRQLTGLRRKSKH